MRTYAKSLRARPSAVLTRLSVGLWSSVGVWLSSILFFGCETWTKQVAPDATPSALVESRGTAASKSVAAPPAAGTFRSGAFADEPTPAVASAPDDRTRVRLATWNLKWLDEDVGGGAEKRAPADYQRLAHYAARLRADVVAVQEVESDRAVHRVFPESDYRAFLSLHGAPQRTGFVVRRELEVTRHPDLLALNVGHLRTGTDITITIGKERLRLLSVHLKSGCYSGPLSRSKACRKLARQVPPLESWIDEREKAQEGFVVLGDFNRRFFESPLDEVWRDLDDGVPSSLALWSPTKERAAACHPKRPWFIDHLVFNQSARAFLMDRSFVEHLYDADDRNFALSDHCPLSVDLYGGISRPPSPHSRALFD